jgi:hypothetical protein
VIVPVDRQPLLGELVRHGEALELPAVGAVIEHKVLSPDLVRPSRRLRPDAEDYKASEAAAFADYDGQTAVERELVLRLASLLWRSSASDSY